tara:strand:- start:274 stop:615 length:342 start_codon:yes stop_codon:yes gene_type:complete
MTKDQITYDKASIAINKNINNGRAPNLKNNNAVRNYAREQYKQCGLSEAEIKKRMNRKDAGHIKARDHGGKNENCNYMWEDRHANRAHQNNTITKSALIHGGRKSKTEECIIC